MRALSRRTILPIIAVLLAGSCSSGSSGTKNAELGSLILTTSEKVLSMLQSEAATLGGWPLVELIENSLSPFYASIAEAAEMFPAAAKEESAADSKRFAYVGLSLTMVKAAQASGGTTLKQPYATEDQLIERLLKAADEDEIGTMSTEDFNEEIRGVLQPLGQIVLVNDKGLADQLVPPDSPLRSNWDKDKDGRIESPLPPVALPLESQWQDFTSDVTFERRRGSLVGRAILELSAKVQRIDLL